MLRVRSDAGHPTDPAARHLCVSSRAPTQQEECHGTRSLAHLYDNCEFGRRELSNRGWIVTGKERTPIHLDATFRTLAGSAGSTRRSRSHQPHLQRSNLLLKRRLTHEVQLQSHLRRQGSFPLQAKELRARGQHRLYQFSIGQGRRTVHVRCDRRLLMRSVLEWALQQIVKVKCVQRNAALLDWLLPEAMHFLQKTPIQQMRSARHRLPRGALTEARIQ